MSLKNLAQVRLHPLHICLQVLDLARVRLHPFHVSLQVLDGFLQIVLTRHHIVNLFPSHSELHAATPPGWPSGLAKSDPQTMMLLLGPLAAVVAVVAVHVVRSM